MVRMEEAVEEEERSRDYLQSFMGMERSDPNLTCCFTLRMLLIF